MMKVHTNSWPLIERELAKKKLAQRALAQYLEITPSAITQAKRGGIHFSLAQLALICEFLHFKEPLVTQLFSEALTARLLRSIETCSCSRCPTRIQELTVRCRLKKTR